LAGFALHNNAQSPTGTTSQYIASGTYTPTMASGALASGITAEKAQWIRVGNVVTVTGAFIVTPTGTGQMIVTTTLPIASTFTADADVSGCAACDDSNADQVMGVRSSSSDRTKAMFIRTIGNTTQRHYTYTYTYEVK
jgi:hypothetical protein